MTSQTDTFLAALLFALIFIFGWRLHRTRTPRAVLSLGAGATASYVFVRMLPELGEAQTAFVAATAGRAPRSEAQARDDRRPRDLRRGVVMNSMVMELPTEKDGRFWPFVVGSAAYTALLLLIR